MTRPRSLRPPDANGLTGGVPAFRKLLPNNQPSGLRDSKCIYPGGSEPVVSERTEGGPSESRPNEGNEYEKGQRFELNLATHLASGEDSCSSFEATAYFRAGQQFPSRTVSLSADSGGFK